MSFSHSSSPSFSSLREKLKYYMVKKCNEILCPPTMGEEFAIEGFTIKVLAPFADSDGAMSDLYLCEKKATDSKDDTTKKVLIKQLRIPEEAINKAIASLSNEEKKEATNEKRFQSLISNKAEIILQNFPLILQKEGKIARKMYGNEFILTHDNKRLIMPFLPGGKLFSEKNYAYIADLNWEQRIYLISKIVDEVARLHSMKIGHFDLKPENILFDPETDSLYLIDFGTSYFLENPEEILTERMGSPAYMSPEASHAFIGLKSDDYSVGKIINEILFEKIAPKEESLSTDFQELANLVQAFAYRLQGKNPQGLNSTEQHELSATPILSKESPFFNNIYKQYRPDPKALKLFFDLIKEYINKYKQSETQDELIAIKEQLQQLAYPDIPFNLNLEEDDEEASEEKEYAKRREEFLKKAIQQEEEEKKAEAELKKTKPSESFKNSVIHALSTISNDEPTIPIAKDKPCGDLFTKDETPGDGPATPPVGKIDAFDDEPITPVAKDDAFSDEPATPVARDDAFGDEPATPVARDDAFGDEPSTSPVNEYTPEENSTPPSCNISSDESSPVSPKTGSPKKPNLHVDTTRKNTGAITILKDYSQSPITGSASPSPVSRPFAQPKTPFTVTPVSGNSISDQKFTQSPSPSYRKHPSSQMVAVPALFRRQSFPLATPPQMRRSLSLSTTVQSTGASTSSGLSSQMRSASSSSIPTQEVTTMGSYLSTDKVPITLFSPSYKRISFLPPIKETSLNKEKETENTFKIV